MTGSRISSASFTKALALVALIAAGCTEAPYRVILPPPGGATALSIDGQLRAQDLDALSPQCVAFVRDVAHVSSSQRIVLLVPGGDADVNAESLTFAQGLREAGYVVRRTTRRKLRRGETLVAILPIADGALQLDDGKSRAWRVEVDVQVFEKSEQPACATRRLAAEAKADLPQP